MKKLTLLLFFVLLISIAVMAQDVADTPEFDSAFVQVILLTGVGGLSVAAATEMLKRLLKATGVLAYVISAVVAVAATAFALVTAGTFTIGGLLIYSVAVFLTANGIYKFSAKSARNQ
ncbi:MAG: hypothetical protein ACTSQ8_26345 [Candidatus Helarchaeota archaeon]